MRKVYIESGRASESVERAGRARAREQERAGEESRKLVKTTTTEREGEEGAGRAKGGESTRERGAGDRARERNGKDDEASEEGV
eukprot:2155434-Pleurochrysis_carterae.AAC.1